MPAIAINKLQFAYPNRDAVLKNINLIIPAGSRFGLFGANGAGKTTLMQIITGLVQYQTGSVQMNGLEVSTNRKTINHLFGFVPQDFSFYHELSPVENLHFFGAWAGLNKKTTVAKTEELLQIMHLQNVKDKPVHTFSGGMKRRVNLAIAVLHSPSILILDEPTVGVDVQSRVAIIDYLKSLNNAGTTLLYTSHQLNEAEDLCTHAAMLDDGQIISAGTLNDLKLKHNAASLENLFLALTGRAYRD